MFYAIRRLIIALLLGLLAYAGWWAYHERARWFTLLDASWILYHQLRTLNAPPRPRALLSGEVTQVIDGNWLCLRATNNLIYCFKHAATIAPELKSPLHPEGDPLGGEAVTNLSQFVLSKQVVIDVLNCDENRNGHGFAYRDGTNVGLPLVERGLARVSREHLKPLPFREQFTLLSAERKARVSKLGLWRPAVE
jgi:endonuclease YncB( thermonuclease family)